MLEASIVGYSSYTKIFILIGEDIIPPIVVKKIDYRIKYNGEYCHSIWNQPKKRMKQFPMFKALDRILHAPLRLAVISLLISVKEAEFTFIKEKTGATAGNLSVQLGKLKEAGYIDISKQFKDNYPLTLCKITKKGMDAFVQYTAALQSYIQPVAKET